MQHADLDGAKAAAARENESCLWLTLARHDAILVKLAALHTRPDHSHEGDNCGFGACSRREGDLRLILAS